MLRGIRRIGIEFRRIVAGEGMGGGALLVAEWVRRWICSSRRGCVERRRLSEL